MSWPTRTRIAVLRHHSSLQINEATEVLVVPVWLTVNDVRITGQTGLCVVLFLGVGVLLPEFSVGFDTASNTTILKLW